MKRALDPNPSSRAGPLGILWNRTERRIRAGFRVLFQLGGQVLLQLGLWAGLLALASTWGDVPPGEGLLDRIGALSEEAPAYRVALQGAEVVAACASVIAACRFLDRRPVADLGLRVDRSWWSDLAFGAALGGVIFAGIFAVELGAGWVTVVAHPVRVLGAPELQRALAAALVSNLAGAFAEEIVHRGYWIRNLTDGFSTIVKHRHGPAALALCVSSAVFGLGHAMNPHATLLSTLSLMAIGLLFGASYVATGRLALPIGLHTAWNFFQGRVFGFAVSGHAPAESLFVLEQRGPTFWTGGAFGPEAGALSLLACCIAVLPIVAWARRPRGTR